MAKKLNELFWIEDLLPENVVRKSMFGGFAYYQSQTLKLVLFEHEGDRSYKNQKFDFDIWFGCMFPVEKINQDQVKESFPFLINHPVLPKWLYLPMQTENFEENARRVLSELRKGNSLFGTMPKPKSGKKKAESSAPKLNMRRPQMFGDEPARIRLDSAQKISDLKNLGPASEAEFKKAGIHGAKAFIDMGWKKAMKKLVAANAKNRHSVFAYALIGALKNVVWNRISEADKAEAREFVRGLKVTKNKKNRASRAKIRRPSR